MKKFYFFCLAFFIGVAVIAQDLLYSNNFENGVGGATIIGNGAIVTVSDPGFGKVFHNALGGQGIRTNYLLLPTNIFANLQASGKKELTIGFWVNKGTAANFFWSPIFSAYGAAPQAGGNTWPMMVLQTRLILQVNNNGWCDFTNAQNTTGQNLVSTTYLDSGTWQYYTVVLTETSAKIYINGVVQNTWNLTGVADGGSVSGLFTNGSALTYICLGGNQAWNWADPDPAFMYDDVVIFSKALSVNDILAIVAAKSTSTSINNIKFSRGDLVGDEYYNISGAKVSSDYNALTPGIYIKKSVYSSGEVKSTKIVKSKK